MIKRSEDSQIKQIKDYSPMSQRMLIVEPDQAVSLLFDQWLQDMGCQATTVRDGGEAMHALRSQSIDGLILDLQAPVMDGLTMLTQLRQRYADIPVIVLAGVDMTDSLVEALESGAHDYLTKPVSQQLFKQKCRRVFLHQQMKPTSSTPKAVGPEDFKPELN